MSAAPLRSMGAFLYVPGDDRRLIASARRRKPDAFILDLEDSVAPARKDLARAEVLEALASNHFPAPVWVRVNELDAGAADEASELATTGRLAGIWLPKVDDSDHIEVIAAVVPSDVRIGVMIESAAGLFAVRQLAHHPRVAALHVGEIDLAADLGIDLATTHVMDPYRAMVVTAAAAARLPRPLGPVWVDVADHDGFLSSTTLLAAQGFGGRACIHPDQLTVVRNVFEPSPDEVAEARSLIRHHDRHQASGIGVYRGQDGTMIDEAVIRRARELIQRVDS